MTPAQSTQLKTELTAKLTRMGEVDICSLHPDICGGIGYHELRYCWIDEEGLCFESNNIHDDSGDEDAYKTFRWDELSDYEKESLCFYLCNE